jgi:outer membrane lipoprotein-sorting protein
MRTTSRCLALVVAILSFGTSLLAQTQTRPDAARILKNMLRAYSRAASYQDEGILVTTTDTPTGGTIEKIPFKTFFQRPNMFRFEWTEFTITKLGRTYRVWFSGCGCGSFCGWARDSI